MPKKVSFVLQFTLSAEEKKSFIQQARREAEREALTVEGEPSDD